MEFGITSSILGINYPGCIGVQFLGCLRESIHGIGVGGMMDFGGLPTLGSEILEI